jgi:uncharacterized protein with HEPN domain
MPLNEDDISCLVDIVDCIMDINKYTRSIKYYQFEKDKMRRLAVERQLEVIGQAANKISAETQNAMKNIPWGQIIGLRNKLARDYGEILTEKIWFISRNSVPELLKELERIEEIKEYISQKNMSDSDQ